MKWIKNNLKIPHLHGFLHVFQERVLCFSLHLYIDIYLYNFLKSNIFCPQLRQQTLFTLNFLVFVWLWYFGNPAKGKLQILLTSYSGEFLCGTHHFCALVGKSLFDSSAVCHAYTLAATQKCKVRVVPLYAWDSWGPLLEMWEERRRKK